MLDVGVAAKATWFNNTSDVLVLFLSVTFAGSATAQVYKLLMQPPLIHIVGCKILALAKVRVYSAFFRMEAIYFPSCEIL